MNNDVLWDNFLNKIKEQITSLAYETWFEDTKLLELKGDTATVLVPMHIHKKHLPDNYSDIIENTFNILTGTNFNIEYLLMEDIDNEEKVDVNNIGIPTNFKVESNLNPNYTFDTFVVGESNKFARTTAVSVAEQPGKMYNPLFIYGSSGLGKTHLMQAIGNHIKNNLNKNVLYITSEQFISDFLNINKKYNDGNNFSAVDQFKNKYRSVDVLIIDDIQFLGGATETQKEFFHTFNKLHSLNKQIIISSDRSPDDLKLLEERLRTRCNWGLTVNIYPPDFELKKEIVKKKISNGEIVKDIPEDVIEYIANNCGNDVRSLEGTVTRLYAYATIMNVREINLEIAIEALKDYINKHVFIKNNIQKIQQIVADYYKITIDDLKSKKRNANVAIPRQIAMYLARNFTEESFPRIGIEFGGKDHSTIMYAVNKISNEMNQNMELKQIIQKLSKDIKS